MYYETVDFVPLITPPSHLLPQLLLIMWIIRVMGNKIRGKNIFGYVFIIIFCRFHGFSYDVYLNASFSPPDISISPSMRLLRSRGSRFKSQPVNHRLWADLFGLCCKIIYEMKVFFYLAGLKPEIKKK